MTDKYVRDESVIRCPHCDRPYVITRASGRLMIIVTHTKKCPITFEDDAMTKIRLKDNQHE